MLRKRLVMPPGGQEEYQGRRSRRLDDSVELDVVTHTAGDLGAGRKAARAVVMGKEKRTLPSPGAFFTNVSGSEPWSRKIRLLLRNNWLKLKHLQNCCGHPGEPGC